MKCPNCGSSSVGRYCAGCGQATPTDDDYSLRAHIADFFEHQTSLDGKFARTVWTLITSPGLLTADHLAGRRGRYVRPLQLFLLVNVLLFLAAPRVPLFSYSLANYSKNAPPSPTLVRSLVSRAVPHGDTASQALYERAFDDRVEAERKSLILIFAPALAIVLRLIFRGGARDTRNDALGHAPGRYGEHLVFALHVLTFVWLVFVGWGALVGANGGRTLEGLTGKVVRGILTLYMLIIPAYFFRASRRVYLLSRARAFGLTLAIGVTFFGLLLAYRALLFFTTYYTL